MAVHYFCVTGSIVPKARPRGTRSGHHYTSPVYREWKDRAISELAFQYDGDPISIPVLIDVVLIGKHRRSGDTDNVIGSLMDAMVQSGILQDDNMVKVPAISVSLSHSKVDPKAFISLVESPEIRIPAWVEDRLQTIEP